MPLGEFSTFVVLHHGHYCRFGSYRTVDLVGNPLKATHYSTEALAKKRIGNAEGFWLKGVKEKAISEFQVVRLTFTLNSQEPVE